MKVVFNVFAVVLFSSVAFAGSHANLTPEQREKMAVAHEKMAACLRSDRAVQECHDELMKACEKDGTCPMKDRKGRGKHQGMQNTPTAQ